MNIYGIYGIPFFFSTSPIIFSCLPLDTRTGSSVDHIKRFFFPYGRVTCPFKQCDVGVDLSCTPHMPANAASTAPASVASAATTSTMDLAAGSTATVKPAAGPAWHSIVAGATAGLVTRLAVNPLDVLKIRAQLQLEKVRAL